MRSILTSRSILATIILTLSLGSPFASHILGTGILPLIRPVSGALGPNNNLGIDCALGASADSPNPFPTPITTKDSDGVIDSGCHWAGDVDGDAAATLDPLTSDSPETLSPQIGGGFIADVIFTNMNQTINGFDITLNYDPRILDFVAFDQSGLTFGGNVGCPAALPQCTLTLVNSADRMNGVIRLAQVVQNLRIGPNGDTGNTNSATLFRLRFDVVGAGHTSIHFGTTIITFAVGISTGADPHFTIDGSFSTQIIFKALNGQTAIPCTLPCFSPSSFNASWSFSPNAEVPGSPLTFTATASCSYCLGALTYNWDFSSVDSSTYISKIDRTGRAVTITAPPPIVNRVTLTVTNGTASASVTRLLPLAAGSPPATLPVATVGSAARGSWLGGVPSYSGSYNLCPAQSSTDFSVCSKPTVIIPQGTLSQNKTVALSYNYAGVYNSTLSVTDSAPFQVSGPNSASTTFLVNITGVPAVFTVVVASNSSTVRAGQTVQFLSTVAYNNTYPTILRSSTFQYTFNFGDGSSQSSSSGQSIIATHKYSSAGNFTVKVTAQETRTTTVSKSRIQENGFMQLGGNQTLSADFTISPPTPQVRESVSFNALASGGTPPYSFAWNFGDGTTSIGNTTTHAYSNAGTYAITLTVTDANSKFASVIHTLTVGAVLSGAPIVAVWSHDCGSFNITNVSCPGVTLTPNHQFIVQVNVTNAPTFNAFEFALYHDPHYLKALTIDVTGAIGQPTVFGTKASVLKNDTSSPGAVYLAVVGLGRAAAFSGGSGTLVNIIFNITGTGVSPLTLAAGMIPTFGFAQDVNGKKPDWTDLVNTNSAGQTYYIGVGTADGYFTNVAGTGKLGPLANFTFSPAMPTQGQGVTFDASSSFDPDNRIGRGIRLYLWDFGDGSSDVTNVTSIFHAYVSPGDTRFLGNFTVRLTVIDVDNGFQGMKVRLITIHPAPPDQPPVASFTFSPANPMAKQLVAFDGTASFDPDGTIIFYTWSFGDGFMANPCCGTAVHIYQNGGNFTVTLTVQDNAGLLGTQSRVIQITGPPAIPPVANFTFSPLNPVVGQGIFFDGSRSSDADGFVTFWSWDFGDGQIGFGTFPSHSYFAPGNYTVTLTVTDSERLSASTSLTVPVHPIPPHDVAIDSVQPNPTRAVSTQIVSITILLENTGNSQVTVNMTAYQDSKVVGSINGATLFPNFDGFHQIYFFTIPWDTTGVQVGNHTITARVFLADDPTPADNFVSGGQVTILPPPVLKLVPISGSLGTKVVIEGSGFPVPQFSFFGQIDFIQVTFDNMTTGFITTSTGTFNFTFDVPLAQPGTHYVNVVDEFSRAHATAAFQVLPIPLSLIVTVTTAAIYFPGDTATIYVLSTLNGVQAGPSGLQIQLILVKPDGSATTLAALFTASGIYKASFTVPKSGSLGTYTLVTTAHMTGASDGSSIASFEVKPTWLSSNASNIAGGATVAGVVGLVAVAWRKGFFKKKDDDQASQLLNGSEGFAE